MRAGTLLAQLALFTSTTNAFFFFMPTWLEEIEQQDHTIEARRDVDSRVDGLTFELGQKENPDPPTQAEKAQWQAALLKNKYGQPNSNRRSTAVGAKGVNQYTISQAIDPDEPKTAGVDQDGTDYSYFIQVQVGSKSKNLYMLIDTGAGSSWLMGSDCTSDACSRHDSFGPGDSDTLQTSSKNFSISYGSGDVTGTLANDTITVAGMEVKYQFGLATTTSSDFVHFAFDGILGLSMNEGANQNFLSALDDANLLENNIFCIALNRASDGTNTGEIKFGSTNPKRFTGDITYTPIESGAEDWAIKLDNIAFDDQKTNVGGIPAYIDTGTSYIFGAPDEVKALHDVIPGAHSSDNVTYTVPCNITEPIVLTFSGADFEVSAKDWISPKNSQGQCTSNFYGYEVVKGSWLLGDTFLKNVYAVFDKGEKQIGFAKRAATEDNSSTAVPSATITSASVPSSTESVPGLSGQETTVASTTASPKPTSTHTTTSVAAATSNYTGSKLSLSICIMAMFLLLS